MARSPLFGRLLKAAIGSIVAHEGTIAPVIEGALGAQAGVSAASIQRYKAGHIPPEPGTLALLATAAVQRGFLGRAWLAAFLAAAGYPVPAALIAQLCPNAAPPALVARVYDNLPAPTYSHFVPRPADTADVFDGLGQRSAVVLIVGIGGAGKTSLAREVASACRDGAQGAPPFAAIVWVSDQDHPGTTTLTTVLHAIARTLDYPDLLQRSPADCQHAVERLLRQQRALLIVDNAETISDATLLHWLARLPEPSKALVASRMHHPELRRSCWPVDLRGLPDAAARTLLSQTLRVLKLEERIHDPALLDTLLHAISGNPKALELALGALKYGAQTIPQVIDDLGAARGDLFDDLFARAWALLDDAARRMLLALPFFAGPAQPDALAAAAAVDDAHTAPALQQLVTLALVDTGALDGHLRRFTCHPLVRAFAHAKLHDQPTFAHAARTRQLAWYAALAARVGYCWDDLARLNTLDGEHETITALIRWAPRDDPALARLVRGVDYYYYVRGLWTADASISTVRAQVAQYAAVDEETVRALAYNIQMLCRQGHHAAAAQQLPQLVALCERDTHSESVQFEVQYTDALYAMACGDDDVAIARWEALLPLAQRVSVRAYAVNRGWLAICHYRQGNGGRAQALWAVTLADCAAGGFVRGVVSSQIGLARLRLDHNDSAAARPLLAAARGAAEGYGDRSALAEIDVLDARCYALLGDDDAAQRCRAAAQDAAERIGIAHSLTATPRAAAPKEPRQRAPAGNGVSLDAVGHVQALALPP